jgi:arylsulfatase A-like enzyme/thioredoxin-like negative regulator of GroEL
MAGRRLRRTLILAGVALGTALSAAGGWRYARASAPLSGPIIVISIDALRADHLPAYGYDKVKTPAIDLLAENGIVFERAYSHTPLTLPAHTALLAGRLPFETGVRDETGAVGLTERLLPELLRDRGYATAAVVSGPFLRRETGLDRGFDFFDDELPPDPDGRAGSFGERDGHESLQIAERWLDAAGTSRLFLFLHLNEPHRPHRPPERFSNSLAYDGEIAYADEIVGRLIRYLKTHQLYDRSTIVLLSDHGEGLGDHGEQGHGLFLYDEVVRVPLIVKQEGNVGAGRRIPDLVQHIDVVPTILDLVNAPVPDGLRGSTLKPLLEGTDRMRDRPPVYSETLVAHYRFGWSAVAALTDGRFQYIKAPREELYDLARDPKQRENVVDWNGEAHQRLDGFREELLRLTGPSVSQAGATAATLPDEPFDPKDKVATFERYRVARELAAARRWTDAIAQFQRVVRDEPTATAAWRELAEVALLVPRHDVTLDAYRHLVQLEPSDPRAYLELADVLLRERRPSEARVRALEALALSADAEAPSRALLARIALALGEADAAREEAALAQKAEPGLPMLAFVEGRVLHDEGRFESAVTWFEQAVAESRASEARIPELHFYAADTLVRVERFPEAEARFLEELRLNPRNLRARIGLATLYHQTERPEAAEEAVSDMLRAMPTAEAYAVAARLLRSFGKMREADAVRAEARRTLPAPSR